MGHLISTEELIRRCASAGSSAEWEEFVRRFQPVIAQTVLRTASRLGDASTATVTDLIQETYLKLCADNFRLLRGFHPTHPEAFNGFIRTVSANLTRDHFRALHAQRRGSQTPHDDSTDEVPAAPATQGGRDALQRTILLREIDGMLDVIIEGADSNRNRHVFWLYYRAGCSAAEIAALPEIELTAKGVESLLLRLTRELRRRIAQQEPRNAASMEGNSGSSAF